MHVGDNYHVDSFTQFKVLNRRLDRERTYSVISRTISAFVLPFICTSTHSPNYATLIHTLT